jgi:hypothetical protein
MALALLLIGGFSMQASGQINDLGIEVNIEPSGLTPPGTEGIISITITNNGPDINAAVFRWIPTQSNAGLRYPPLQFTGLTTGPCGFSSIGLAPPGDNFGFWVTPSLLIGESVICTYEFVVDEMANSSQIARWDVSFVAASEDPNEANNVAEVLLVFSGPPDTRPVPTVSWISLLMRTLVVGMISLRRLA